MSNWVRTMRRGLSCDSCSTSLPMLRTEPVYSTSGYASRRKVTRWPSAILLTSTSSICPLPLMRSSAAVFRMRSPRHTASPTFFFWLFQLLM